MSKPQPDAMPTLAIINSKGRRFTVTYGIRCSERPTVNFYDATYAGHPVWGDLGQFVADYHPDTLLDDAERIAAGGLDLCGHEPVWKIDRLAMRVVLLWVAMMKDRL